MQALKFSVLIFLITFVAFLEVRNFDFVNFDDDQYLRANNFVQHGITLHGLKQAFLDTSTGHWHPLTWISYMLDTQFFGVSAKATHLANVALHSFGAALLFIILFQLTQSKYKAITVALLFALHPMRMESVVWISQRKDVLSMALGLLSICYYTKWIQTRNAQYYFFTCLFFLFALSAKPTLITLPLLLLALDYWPLRRLDIRALKEKIPLAIIAVIFSVITVFSQQAGAGLRTASEIDLSTRFGTAMIGLVAYLGKLFFPTGFGVFYPNVAYAPGIAAGCFVALLAISVLLFQRRNSEPYLIFGWCWFLIALLPVAGFVSIGGQTFADRWTYLAHIGGLIASVWFLSNLIERYFKYSDQIKFSCALFAIIGCTWILQRNLPIWTNSETLWAHTLKVSPNNFMAHTNLGSTLDQQGRIIEAGVHFEEAARLNPTYPEALNNLGAFRARQNKFKEAEELFQRALQIRPTFLLARYHLGLTRYSLGDPLSATIEWINVLKQEPGYSPAQGSLEFIAQRPNLIPCNTAPAHTTLKNILHQWQTNGGDEEIKSKLLKVVDCN